MLEERGVVISVNEQFTTVQTKRSNSCGECAANKSCGTASLANVLGQKYTEIKAIRHENAKVGDTVIIGLSEQTLVRSALLLYLLPLLTMFVMAISYKTLALMLHWQQSELLIALAGLTGLLLGFIVVKIITSNMSKNIHYQPIIHKIIRD